MLTKQPIPPTFTPPSPASHPKSHNPPTADNPILPPNQEQKVLDVYNAQPHYKFKLNQQTGFWDKYNKQADAYDKDLVKALALDLDTLLIFVGSYISICVAS